MKNVLFFHTNNHTLSRRVHIAADTNTSLIFGRTVHLLYVTIEIHKGDEVTTLYSIINACISTRQVSPLMLLSIPKGQASQQLEL